MEQHSNQEPTTRDDMEMYAALAARVKVLKASLAQAENLQAALAATLVARLPPEDNAAKYAHTFGHGVTVTVGWKESKRWVPVDGQSDDFWSWVQAESMWQFTTRTLKQEGVDTYIAANGGLPPFVKQMTSVAPDVRVKGLSEPAPPKTNL